MMWKFHCGYAVIDLDYCDIEWFALETNRDHSVIFEIASKYCISDSFVDHNGYSISSEGFLPVVVDTITEIYTQYIHITHTPGHHPIDKA